MSMVSEYKMKKKNLTRICTYIAGMTLLAGAFTGCGKKTVDYSIETEDYTMATKLGVPDTVNVAIDTGNSGLNSISIKTDDIELPDATSMSIVYFDKLEMTKEYRQTVAEYLLDKDAGIYIYDEEGRTAEDLEIQLNFLKLMGDDTDTASLLEEQIETAPDSYTEADNYSYDYYTGIVNEERRILRLDDITGCQYSMYRNLYQALNEYRSYEGAETACFYEGAETDEFDGENTCSITESQAADKAEDLLEKLGMTGLLETESDVIVWEYCDSEYNLIAEEYDGYYFIYKRYIDNIPIYYEDVTNVDNLYYSDETGSGNLTLPEEWCMIAVDGNGILYANWGGYASLTGETENDVALLSWNELIEKMNENLSEYYEKYPTSYSDITFDKAVLTYFPITDGDGGKFVPTWVFTQSEGENNSDETVANITQIAVISAVDGSVIDIPEVAKAFGGY